MCRSLENEGRFGGVVVASDPKNAHVGLSIGPAPKGYPSGAPPRERSTVTRDPAVAGALRRGDGREGCTSAATESVRRS